MDQPSENDLIIFENHRKERFGQFHKFYCDEDGYCHCEVCIRVKEYFKKSDENWQTKI